MTVCKNISWMAAMATPVYHDTDSEDTEQALKTREENTYGKTKIIC